METSLSAHAPEFSHQLVYNMVVVWGNGMIVDCDTHIIPRDAMDRVDPRFANLEEG